MRRLLISKLRLNELKSLVQVYVCGSDPDAIAGRNRGAWSLCTSSGLCICEIRLLFARTLRSECLLVALETLIHCADGLQVWATLVYDPIACWVWNPNGWSMKMGTLDFAGGGPVHMTSGVGALAYSIWLGKRKGYGTNALAYKPQNITHVVLGTVSIFQRPVDAINMCLIVAQCVSIYQIFLWFGWFGFNGGSALASNLRASQAMIVTNTAASVGGLAWMIVDWRLEHKWSAVGFCSGAVSGLVAITPAAGYVTTPSAVAIGVVAGVVCNYATQLKAILHYDDAVDIFAVHGVGGLVGNLMTAMFADKRIATFDSTIIDGGFMNHHWVQLAYHLADSSAIFGYTFVVTMAILIVMDFIPGLSLRVSEEGEELGIDASQIGEMAYDYAVTREVSEASLYKSLVS